LDTRPRQLDDAAGGIDVLDGGVDGFLPLKHLHQPVKARVGHTNNTHMCFRPPCALPTPVRSGKNLKQGRLAHLGQPNDTNPQQGRLRMLSVKSEMLRAARQVESRRSKVDRLEMCATHGTASSRENLSY
jgi:hypothetical protein